jgi:hypothetical protein
MFNNSWQCEGDHNKACKMGAISGMKMDIRNAMTISKPQVHISLKERQFVVTPNSSSKTEIPGPLESWVTNTPVKMLR